MTRTIITSNEMSSGVVRQGDNFNDDFEVARDVLVHSTGSSAFYLTSSSHDVTVRGTVVGVGGVALGNSADDSALHLLVTATGLIFGTQSGASLFGSGRIDNGGSIVGGNIGVSLYTGSGGPVLLKNTGQITGGSTGIYTFLAEGAAVRVINDGTVNGGTGRSFWGDQGTKDVLVNRGLMIGTVDLGGGNDFFDNSLGVLRSGSVLGGMGADIFAPGRRAEIFDGGGDTDTLDFRSSRTGVRVSLLDADGSGNTGPAENDTYTGIERILGSSTGDDTLVGDGLDNILEGFGGDDILRGGDGNDTFEGGAGQDWLTGGPGYDIFRFAKPTDGRDRITDFSVDDNIGFDTIQISAKGFGGDLNADIGITEAMFAAQNDSLARSRDVRFIWEKDDTRLWFDGNGSKAGGLFLIADLQANAEFSRFHLDLV